MAVIKLQLIGGPGNGRVVGEQPIPDIYFWKKPEHRHKLGMPYYQYRKTNKLHDGKRIYEYHG